MLGLANMVGRVAWPIVSDDRGRKRTFSLMFLVMAIAFAVAPFFAASGSEAGFVAAVMSWRRVACFGAAVGDHARLRA
jgi:predicted MFS family arabinose efflux permease